VPQPRPSAKTLTLALFSSSSMLPFLCFLLLHLMLFVLSLLLWRLFRQ